MWSLVNAAVELGSRTGAGVTPRQAIKPDLDGSPDTGPDTGPCCPEPSIKRETPAFEPRFSTHLQTRLGKRHQRLQLCVLHQAQNLHPTFFNPSTSLQAGQFSQLSVLDSAASTYSSPSQRPHPISTETLDLTFGIDHSPTSSPGAATSSSAKTRVHTVDDRISSRRAGGSQRLPSEIELPAYFSRKTTRTSPTASVTCISPPREEGEGKEKRCPF